MVMNLQGAINQYQKYTIFVCDTTHYLLCRLIKGLWVGGKVVGNFPGY